ncbi:MAG TPA: DUF4105 domain-containing protein, partial [Nevskiaceae bacterium]|nr:DUF4105 domain-containing protein [Nevskiaceae bacterium]
MTGRRLRAAVFFCALLAQAARAGASADASYLAELQARAHATVLAQQPAWLRLGHWRPDRIGHGYNSTIDSPGFFLAKDGRGEPAAELDATLELFFSGTQIAGEPAQCRYLARYQWLRRQLEFDPARLPEASCERYQEWARGLDAARIAVVFASNDLNSPSSMFGHTLLRIDTHGQGDNERLLAYALNYAAADVNDGGVTYAWRGITGGYEGYFSIYPYYDKVKEYARFEHRDLWEYPLRLAADQVQLLLWHVWELRGVGSSYYFFSENCSYQLLSLIEVARPDLDLTGPFRRGVAYTIPVDTIRALRDSGLLDAPAYRPAAAKVFQHDYHQLGDDEQAWVQRYVRGEAGFDDAVFARADDAGRARMLEMAHEQLYFLFQQGEMPRSAGLERDHAALVERSRLPVDSGFAPAPQPAMPDQGHSSARTAAGARIDAHAAAAVLRWRPSYHDRLDPPAGYLSGGEIRFFDVSALAGDGGVRLDQVTLLSVQAVSPRDATFKPWSWQVALGARRL